jgi:hypothetical protein
VNLVDTDRLDLPTTSDTGREQPDAFGLNPPPEISPGVCFDPVGEWTWAHMQSEVAAKSLTNVRSDLVELGLLGDRLGQKAA